MAYWIIAVYALGYLLRWIQLYRRALLQHASEAKKTTIEAVCRGEIAIKRAALSRWSLSLVVTFAALMWPLDVTRRLWHLLLP